VGYAIYDSTFQQVEFFFSIYENARQTRSSVIENESHISVPNIKVTQTETKRPKRNQRVGGVAILKVVYHIVTVAVSRSKA